MIIVYQERKREDLNMWRESKIDTKIQAPGNEMFSKNLHNGIDEIQAVSTSLFLYASAFFVAQGYWRMSKHLKTVYAFLLIVHLNESVFWEFAVIEEKWKNDLHQSISLTDWNICVIGSEERRLFFLIE